MKFGFVEEKNTWDELVGQIYPNQFLQSWQWGEFQRKLGRRVWRFKIEREDTLVALGQAIEYGLPFGFKYIYLPRGPLTTAVAENHAADFTAVFQKRIKALSSKAVFVRVESTNFDFSDIPGFARTRSVQPNVTSVINLKNDAEHLLESMHQKTRYNIRLAEKHGVGIRKMQESEFGKFWELMGQTAERDRFRAHPRSYYETMIRELDMCEVWFAEYQGKVLAANLMVFWGDTAVYVHGASSGEFRNVMAPYLLHWEMIKRGRERGYRYYDFWGIAPADQPNHPWAGITRFKKGFGGAEVKYPGTFDFPMKKLWYWAYRLKTKR